MIGIIAHSEKKGGRVVTLALVEELEKRGERLLLESQTARLIHREGGVDEAELAAACELIVVLGGDGTILRAVHRIGEQLRPLLGINIGSLGFLTCVGPDDMERAVRCIVSRTFVLSPRTLIHAELLRRGATIAKLNALNDVVVSRGERSQLVMLEVRVDHAVLTTYNADGLIFATPTGSTAYSLSAGGPILTPDSGAFVITPICPHVLTNRSTVVGDSSVIEIRVIDRKQEVFVNVDGRIFHEMHAGDVLRVTKSDLVLPLAMLPGLAFPDILRAKMRWSGSYV